MTELRRHLRGIGIALGGYTLWVFADTLMKLAGEAALPPYEILGFLGLFMALILIVVAVSGGRTPDLWPQNPRAQLGRACLSMMSNLMNVIALKHLPLTLFYITVFTAPMIISLLAALWLREHLTVPKIAAIIVGFVGVIIAINPFGQTGGEAIGYVAALVSTLCYAGSSVWLRRMTQSETIMSIALFTSILELVCGLGLTLLLRAEPVTTKILLILLPA